MARWRPLLLAFAAALAAPVSASAQALPDATTSSRVDPGRTGFLGGATLGRPPLIERWRIPLVDGAVPLVADGLVFTSGQEAESGPYVLQARRIGNGERVWSRSMPRFARTAYGEGRLVVRTAGGTVMAIDGADGRTLWTRQLQEPYDSSGSPLVADGRVYVSSVWSNGVQAALDLDDGKVIWQRYVSSSSETALAGGQLLVARSCGGYALTPGDGTTPRWDRITDCGGFASDDTDAASDGGVLTSSAGAVLDAADGRLFDQAAVNAAPALAGDLLVTTGWNALIARSLSRQVDAWSVSGPFTASPLVVDGIAYAGTRDGELRAYELATGVLVWSTQLGPRDTWPETWKDDVGYPGMAAGGGLLLVPVGGELVAMGSALPNPAAGLRITDGPSGPTRADSGTFTFTPSVLPQTCALDSAPALPCARSVRYAGLAEGPHTVTVRAIAADGTVHGVASRGFTVDRTAPVAAFKPDDPGTLRTSPYVEGHASTPEGSPVECRLDNRPWGACGPYPGRVLYTALPDGPHLLELRSTDALGNVPTEPTRWAFTVDTVGPSVTIDERPPQDTQSGEGTVAFTVGSDATRIWCEVEGVRREPCTSPVRLTGLEEGNHAVVVRATDAAGNETSTYASWRVDRTPPSWILRRGPESPTRAARASFEVSPDYYYTDGRSSTYDCRTDDGPWVACDVEREWQTDVLQEGEHGVTIRATDGAGNVQPDPPTVRFTVDRTPPPLVVTERPPARTTPGRVRVAFDTEPRATAVCKLDNVVAECESPWTSQPLEAGSHLLRVTVADVAGNERWDETAFEVAAADGDDPRASEPTPTNETPKTSTGTGVRGAEPAASTPAPTGVASPAGSGPTGRSPAAPSPTRSAVSPDRTTAVTRVPATSPADAVRALRAWLARRSGRAIARARALGVPYTATTGGTLRLRLVVGKRRVARSETAVQAGVPTWARLVLTRTGRARLRGARTVRIEVGLTGPGSAPVRVVRTVRLR